MPAWSAEYLTKPIDRDRLVDVLQKYHAAGAGAQVLIVEDDESTPASVDSAGQAWMGRG